MYVTVPYQFPQNARAIMLTVEGVMQPTNVLRSIPLINVM
jgi:hypothetical protein